MTKVQITLTDQEADVLSGRAMRLGYGLTRYLKFLISQNAVEILNTDNMPTFKMSAKTEGVVKKARKDFREGETFLLHKPEDLMKI